ncbi:hypothetical protein L7F22_068542 [Adiantum nelumboides]|nr:hypothetical protein [Adiantum nelumboides]
MVLPALVRRQAQVGLALLRSRPACLDNSSNSHSSPMRSEEEAFLVRAPSSRHSSPVRRLEQGYLVRHPTLEAACLASSNNKQQQQQPGGLFGQTQNNQQQSASGGFGFGAPQQQQTNNAGGFTFGQNNAQQQNKPAGGLFGGGGFGANNQAGGLRVVASALVQVASHSNNRRRAALVAPVFQCDPLWPRRDATRTQVNFSPALETAASSRVSNGVGFNEADSTFNSTSFSPQRGGEETPSKGTLGADTSLPALNRSKGKQVKEDALLPLDYWTTPALSELRDWSHSELQAVEGFVVGRRDFGSVAFDEPVDLTTVGELSNIPGGIVILRTKECIVYPDEDECVDEETGKERDGVQPGFEVKRIPGGKAEQGSGLNVAAVVKLDKCWPYDRSTRLPIKDEEHIRFKQLINKLKRRPDAHFLSFEASTGTWVFRVDHFSRYGLDETDEEATDEDLPGKKTGRKDSKSQRDEDASSDDDEIPPPARPLDGSTDEEQRAVQSQTCRTCVPLAIFPSNEERRQRARVEALLDEQLKHSVIDDDEDGDCPVVYPAPGLRFSHFVGALEGGEDSHYLTAVFKLGVALFDEVDLKLDIGAEQASDLVDEVITLRRRNNVANWIRWYVGDTIWDEVRSHLASTGKNAGERSIFSYLSGGYFEEACKQAIDSGDVRLATLIAQASSGGEEDEFRLDLLDQLSVWRSSGADVLISTEYRRIFELLSGNVTWSRGNGKREESEAVRDLSIVGGLDWVRTFALYLHYDAHFDSSLAEALQRYEANIVDGDDDERSTDERGQSEGGAHEEESDGKGENDGDTGGKGLEDAVGILDCHGDQQPTDDVEGDDTPGPDAKCLKRVRGRLTSDAVASRRGDGSVDVVEDGKRGGNEGEERELKVVGPDAGLASLEHSFGECARKAADQTGNHDEDETGCGVGGRGKRLAKVGHGGCPAGLEDHDAQCKDDDGDPLLHD